MRRFRALEDLQAEVVADINARYLGQTVEVLVEEQHKGKWKGRTRTNKLVFFDAMTAEWTGRVARGHHHAHQPVEPPGPAATAGGSSIAYGRLKRE